MVGYTSLRLVLIDIDHKKIKECGREDFMLSVKWRTFLGVSGVNLFGLMKWDLIRM